MPQIDHLDALASAILQETHDEIFEQLKALEVLTTPQLLSLAAKLELCPYHCCDLQICIDDAMHGDEIYNQAEYESYTDDPAVL